jgi:hypothetical protein
VISLDVRIDPAIGKAALSDAFGSAAPEYIIIIFGEAVG